MRVVVIGGGPAGVSAALRAAELGAEVTLLERNKVGGISLNQGPAPVRTLARAARLVRDQGSWETFGLSGPRPQVDVGAVLANAIRVADYAHEHKHLADQIRAAGVDLVENTGEIRFLDSTTVAGAEQKWSADRFVIATGGHVLRPSIPGSSLGLTYEDVPTLTALPRRIAVIGAGDTGCQLASILSDFGCEVVLVEGATRIAPQADGEISRVLESSFIDRGMTILTGAVTTRLTQVGDEVCVGFERAEESAEIAVDAVFFTAGWPGNADYLNLAAAAVSVNGRGHIAVDEYRRTTAPHIYAAGDIDGRSMLVASAMIEGRIAAENAVIGTLRPMSYEIIPVGSFTDPEYGSVGLTEERARVGFDCVVAVAHYEDLLRPVADARPAGFCKLIVDRQTRRLLGAHVLGEYSAEVIQTAAALMVGRVSVDDIAQMQFAFPTFTEAIGTAAQIAVHQLGSNGQMTPWTWSGLSILSQ